MEVPGGHNNKAFVIISEVVGTALVMVAVNWGATGESTHQSIAGMVFILTQLFGGVSGGHFNPAVTLAVLFKEGSENWMRNFTFTIMLIIVQGIGAMIGLVVCAGGFSYEKQGDAKKIVEGGYHVAQLCPSAGCNDGGELILKVFFAEALATFLFISFFLMVVKHNGASEAPINAIAIAIALYCGLTLVSGISGGCLNPCVGLFQSIFQKMVNKSIFPNAPETGVLYVPAYVGGPFLGGFIAGMFHKWIHEKALSSAQEQAEFAEYKDE